VSYAYDYENPVFKDVNFEINEGEFWGILGKNGAGKTSLVEVLLGLRWTDTGDVKILGKSNRTRDKDYLKNISFLSHDIQLPGSLKISEFLNFHSFFYENYSKEIEADLLNYFSIDKDKKIGTLSTGQQRKIQIIAGLAANTKLIIIDEITAVLDPESRARLYIKLHDHSKQMNKTILLATNLIEDLEIYADKILHVSDSTTEVLSSKDLNGMFKKI